MGEKLFWRRVNKQLAHLAPVDLREKSYVELKLQIFAYFVYNASCAVSRCLDRFLLSVFLDAFPFDLTLSITSISYIRRSSIATGKLPENSMSYFCCEPFEGSEPCVSLLGGMTQLTAALMR